MREPVDVTVPNRRDDVDRPDLVDALPQWDDGIALLRPQEQVFEGMLLGWRNQQLARRLAFEDITYLPEDPSPDTTTNAGGQAGAPTMLLRLGDPPVPVPAPLDQLIAQLAANRVNMSTATNPTCRWLFPGGRSSQPLTEGTLRQHFQALGMPTTPARTSALRTLTLQAPAPVVATALSYDPATTEQHRTRAGGDWSRYTTLDR